MVIKPVPKFTHSKSLQSMTTTFLKVVIVWALGCVSIFATTPRAGTLRLNVPCKYSVRDVAFVNVHGRSWQLNLIKNSNIQQSDFEKWNESLRIKLADSNVGFVWHDSDSDRATQLVGRSVAGKTSISNDLPMMFLSGPQGVTLPLAVESNLPFEQQIDLLVDSPARKKILNQLVDSLCVVLLIESGGQADSKAMTAAKSAIAQVNNQMWTLEKPTDKGPALETVSVEDVKNEKWLLSSLGVDVDALPAVVIIYGQGRRLGEVLIEDNITSNKIVGRASICGHDCECDLNRQWLYGQQMIHGWTKNHERMAEKSLSFDPNSAFVIAEVAQIIRKNSTKHSLDERVNLGGGLVIHDLTSVGESPSSIAVSPEIGSAIEEPATEPEPELNVPFADSRGSNSTGSRIPWSLLACLCLALVAVSFWMCRKASRTS